ncbi:MAG: Threonine dehydrogenase and related Zn-dependent dehydrogenases, partial [uncultured Nocardioides sp.]
EGSHLAGRPRHAGERGPGPAHRGAHRRDRQDHLHGSLRLGPPPLRDAGALHGARRHRRPRADGHRRGGRIRDQQPRGRRPGRHPVQRLLRVVLDVPAGTALPVRDHAEPRARHRRELLRLQQALRAGPGRAGGVPPRPLRRLHGDEGAEAARRRPLPLPLRRPAHRVAGVDVRRRPRRRHPPRARRRTDRRHGGPHGRTGRPPRHRGRPDPGAARARRGVRRRAAELRGRREGRRRGRRGPGGHRRPRPRRGDRRRRDGGPRLPGRAGRPEGRRRAARRDLRAGDEERRPRPPRRAAHRHRRRTPRWHDLHLGRVRRLRRPDADDADVRQADPAPHGPGQRAPLDRRPAAAPRRRRPVRRRRVRHPPPPAVGGAERLRALPEEGGGHGQGGLPAL